MRMKFNKPSESPAIDFPRRDDSSGSRATGLLRRGGLGQLLLVSAASLGVAGLMTACSQITATLTVDFVYVSSAKAAGADNYGEVNVFEINSESGRMRQIPSSPFPSGGRNPVAEAVSPDNANLYVVNEDDNTIVQFAIGSDGKLYPQNTVNTPGVFPLAVSVANGNLFVADTYQPLSTCSPASPCSGSVAVFPILPKAGSTPPGKLQTNTTINSCNGLEYAPLNLPGAASDVIAPTAINGSADGANLFVTAVDTTSKTGYLFAYGVSTIDCGNAAPNLVLTPLPGSPYPAGSHPSAATSDPSGSYVFVTDLSSSNIRAYAVSTSGLVAISGSPFPTGNQPTAVAIDATGKFAMVTESQDSTVSTYAINNGVLSRTGSSVTGLQPVAVGIDPRLNKYVFTANFLGNNVSGFALNQDGSLLNTQFSPFGANANPTAVAAIPHNGSTN
jgi:6-phosphogluconolactonase (cycloisomerase 2 family)